MKKLAMLTGVIALASTFGFAGAAMAGLVKWVCDNTGGSPTFLCTSGDTGATCSKNSDCNLRIKGSTFQASIVKANGAETCTDASPADNQCDGSLATVDQEGRWEVHIDGLTAATYQICFVDENVSDLLDLFTITSGTKDINKGGELDVDAVNLGPTPVALEGPSFELWTGNMGNCTSDGILQFISGVTIY